MFAIDPVAQRRDHAARLGATPIAAGPDARALLSELTNGAMVDKVFEASGSKAAVESVPALVRHGGTASFIGLPQGDTALLMKQLIYKNLTIRAGVAPVPQMWAELIPLLQQGRVRADGLFSHHLNLSDGAEGYRIFDGRTDGVLKIMFNVS